MLEKSPALPPLSPQEELERRIIPTRKEEERFNSKIQSDPVTHCWLWQGSKTNGYGTFYFRGKMRKAHRISYMIFKSFYPEGTETDHVLAFGCANRNCVNPDHLQAVSHQTNTLRGETIPARNASKTHCPQGHSYDKENTYISPKGQRHCRRCMNAANLRYYAEHRETEKMKRRERWARLEYGKKYKQQQQINYLKRRARKAA